MLFNCQDHNPLKEFVTHHELFGGTRDVPVVVEDSHAGIASDVSLEDHMVSQIDICLCFLRGPNSEAFG